MATTALIVELLVVGILATVWIYLFGFAFWSNLASLRFLKPVSAYLPAYLSLAYCLGILINRFCDFIFKPLEKTTEIYQEMWEDENEYAYARLVVFHGSPGLTAYLDKLWALVRIFRSMMLNSAILTLAWAIIVWGSVGWSTINKILCIFVSVLLEIILLFLLWKSWKIKTEHYHTNLKLAAKIVSSDKCLGGIENKQM